MLRLALVTWLTAVGAAAAQSPPSVHVRVSGYGRPRLVLHEPDGGLASSLCELPCELDLQPGEHTFGVSRDDADAVRPDHATFELREDTGLRIEYRSHSALRVGGWIMLAAGSASGSAMIAAGMLFGWFFGWANLAILVPGAGLILFSLVHWLANAFRNDHVDITEEPLVRF